MKATRRQRATKLLIMCGTFGAAGAVSRARTNAEAIRIIRLLERRLAKLNAPILDRVKQARRTIERKPLVLQ